ncbi:MAG: T9SS type A sorting domain-containing protein [Bacteroidia bacterium]|nr:T9SS type A sorting domain-containing protein [Bacteroidia bacterium]
MNLTKTSLFKQLIAFTAAGLMATTAFGQSQQPTKNLSAKGHVPAFRVEAAQAEQTPVTEGAISTETGSKVTVDAQWDLQFAFDASTTLGYFANAGAYWTGTEFWTSKWNSDTLARLNASGALIEIFTVPGVTGIRSITSDGTSIFLGGASTSIYQVNPATKTLTSTITITGSASTIGSRFLTYDPTLNAGAGGFYIGNFTSAIGVLNKTGATITTIAQTVHGREGMYGAAYDPISTGGPYLWVFEQSANPSDAMISQLKLPAGTWTGVSFDVDGDLALGGALAGGLFIAPNIVTGQNTIGGMAQGTPNTLFGYELDFVPIQIDANLSTASLVPGLSIVPKNQVPGYTFQGEVFNFGQTAITSGTLDVEVIDLEDFSTTYTGSASLGGIASLSSKTFNVGPWTPTDTGAYVAAVYAGTGAQADENLSNDSAFFGIFVSDSTVARDQGGIIANFGVGAGAGQNAVLAHSLSIESVDYLTSVTMAFGSPPVGTQVFASIYAANPATGGPQNAPIANTEVYQFSQDDADNGVVLTLAISGNPQPLPPGTFFVGVNELGTNLGLAATGGIFTEGALWFRANNISGGAWQQATNQVVLVMRANFGACTPTPITGSAAILDDDAGTGDATLAAQVTGGSGVYTYLWNDPAGSTTATISNVAGGRTYTVIVTDSEGCQRTYTSDVVGIWTIGIENELPQGVSAFSAYPSPARGEFFAEIEMEKAQDVTLTFMDANGRMIFSKEMKNVVSVVEPVVVSNYPAGIYMIQITTDQGSVTRKISVE